MYLNPEFTDGVKKSIVELYDSIEDLSLGFDSLEEAMKERKKICKGYVDFVKNNSGLNQYEKIMYQVKIVKLVHQFLFPYSERIDKKTIYQLKRSDSSSLKKEIEEMKNSILDNSKIDL